MQENSVSNRDYLYSVFVKVKSIRDNIALNDLIYVGQEANLLDKKYSFTIPSYSIADPYSSDLLSDLNFLEKEGYIKDTNSAESLVVTQKTYTKQIPELSNDRKLDQLFELNRDELRTLGKIIKIREEIITENGKRKDLAKNIAAYLWMDVNIVNSNLGFFNKIAT